MKSYNTSLQLSEFSTIQVSPLPKSQLKKKLWSGMGLLLKCLLVMLMDTSEIQVQQRRDRRGHTYYVAFNRRTHQRFSAVSEQEIRTWIEQQYYT